MGNVPAIDIKRISLALTLALYLPLVSTTTENGTLSSLEGGVASIMDGLLLEQRELNMTLWKLVNNSIPEEIALTKCWDIPNGNGSYEDAGLWYSRTFGYVIAEKQSFQRTYFPKGKYWNDPDELERNCFCDRRLAWITPPLEAEMVRKNVTYTRLSGSDLVHLWEWVKSDGRATTNMDERSRSMVSFMTIYKALAIKLFLNYVEVTADCEEMRTNTSIEEEDGVASVNWADNYVIGNWYMRSERWPNRVTKVVCRFKGRYKSFEPLLGYFMVQEYDREYRKGWRPSTWYGAGRGRGESTRLAASSNIWPSNIKFPWPNLYDLPPSELWHSRIRWLEATDRLGHTRDGEVTWKAGGIPIYTSHPSMRKDDDACQRRTRKHGYCRWPVVSMRAKLRFGKKVHFDPASNQRRFPTKPIQIRGKLGKEESDVDHASAELPGPTTNKRKKRWSIANEIIGDRKYWVSEIRYKYEHSYQGVRDELHASINQTIDQINVLDEETEARIKTVADRLNQFNRRDCVENEHLNTLVTIMLQEEAAYQEEIRYLQEEVSQTQRIVLQEFNTFLASVKELKKLSWAELAIDKLVMETLTESKARPLLDKTKAYTIQISQGILRLQEYARLISASNNELNTTKQRGVVLAAALRKRLSNETWIEDRSHQAWLNSTNATRMYINSSRWRNQRIIAPRFNETFFDKAFETHFVNNTGARGVGEVLTDIGHGILGIVEQPVSWLENLAGKGVSDIFSAILGPLLKVIAPILALAAGVITMCCCIQHIGKCSPVKRKLPEYFQAKPANVTSNASEAIKKHELRKLLQKDAKIVAAGGADLATLIL